MMTSFAFILGVVPLVMSEGAGAEMRRTLGTAVFAGMLGVTLFGIFLTPVFYYVIQWFTGGGRQPAVEAAPRWIPTPSPNHHPQVRDDDGHLTDRPGERGGLHFAWLSAFDRLPRGGGVGGEQVADVVAEE